MIFCFSFNPVNLVRKEKCRFISQRFMSGANLYDG